MNYSGITLVTGAAGFMGSHVVEHLVGTGARVRATSRSREDISFFSQLGVEFVAADLTRPDTLPRLFEGDVDRVFHLGAVCNFSTPYQKLYPTNVIGVGHISQLALEKGVKCFIHVTSTSVYGYYTGKPYTEKDRRNPEDSYGKSKKGGEDVIFQRIEEGLPAIIVRPCTVYGPRCNDGAGKVFSRPSSISAIPGNGRQLLSNIRAEDVAGALEYLSHKESAIGEIYNIAEDTNPSLEEALMLAARTYNSKPPKLHLPLSLIKSIARLDGIISGLRGKIPDLEYDATKYLNRDYIVDNSKLKEAGYRFQFPNFRESIEQLGLLYRGES